MIQHHILRTNIIKIVWQTVRRVTNEILEVKGFKRPYLFFFFLDVYISLLSQTTSVSANVTFYSRVCEWYGKWKKLH